MELNICCRLENFPIRGQRKISFYFTKNIGLYLCTSTDNDRSKIAGFHNCRFLDEDFEYNAQIEVNPNNRYELLPHIIGAKGPIRPTNGKGIFTTARKSSQNTLRLVLSWNCVWWHIRG